MFTAGRAERIALPVADGEDYRFGPLPQWLADGSHHGSFGIKGVEGR
jgi:hypothetical protein